MKMVVGAALLERVVKSGHETAAVVGTAKNVGKTVTLRALYEASDPQTTGVASIGRDGEAYDVVEGQPKPRLYLRAGTTIATARHALPRTPAVEILRVLPVASALGALVLARVRTAGYFELVGAATASQTRVVVEHLRKTGCERVLLDGAVDRLAALAQSDAAIIACTGAGAAATAELAAERIGDLLARLRIPKFDASTGFITIDGALSANKAWALIEQGERRQVVVEDPTRVAFGGASFAKTAARLPIRCRYPLDVVAVTAASISTEGYFEPRAFLEMVARATRLPAYDVYAGRAVA